MKIDPPNESSGNYFALLRLFRKLRGGDAARSEGNWLEAYVLGAVVYLISYLFRRESSASKTKLVANRNRPATTAFRYLDQLAHRSVSQFVDRKGLRNHWTLHRCAAPARAKRFDGNPHDGFRCAVTDGRSVPARDRSIVDFCRCVKSRRRFDARPFS